MWTHRILLESLCHGDNSFVTLTYQDPAPEELEAEHLRDFLKRFRRRIQPRRVRYFAVGEYGDHFGRPHFHLALFGWPPWSIDVVKEAWGFGFVSVLPLELKSAQYIAGYVTKKMLSTSTTRRKEFARMSLKPGLGADALWDTASAVMQYGLKAPSALRLGPIPRPMGRYLRNKLLEYCGEEKEEYIDKVLPVVRAFAWQNDRSVASVFEELNSGACAPYQPRGSL